MIHCSGGVCLVKISTQNACTMFAINSPPPWRLLLWLHNPALQLCYSSCCELLSVLPQGLVGLHRWVGLGQLVVEGEMLVVHCNYLADQQSSPSIQQEVHCHWMGLIHHASLPLDLSYSSGQKLYWWFSRWCYSGLFDQLPDCLPSVAVWKPVHHICMTHSSWCWAFSRYLLTYVFILVSTSALLRLFLHVASGSYLTPSWAFHRVCVFRPPYLLLQQQPFQTGHTFLWLVLRNHHTEVPWTGWQLDLEFVFSISILKLFQIKLWPFAWFSFGSTETGSEQYT